jgi:DNA polymerase-3 subunit epsilon
MIRKWRNRKRCHKLAETCGNAALGRYFESCGSLEIDHIGNTPLIAADLELTGLDAGSNEIIAIGWTLIDNGRIRMGTNRHLLISANHSVGSSAVIHELMDHEVALGMDLEAGLEALFSAAEGRVWVFHHAGLDVAFLQQACLGWMGVKPPFVVLDTMQIELALRKRRDIAVQNGDLQLGRLRNAYHLPRYSAHDALIDATATAELLLAIAARLDNGKPLKLAPHLRFI